MSILPKNAVRLLQEAAKTNVCRTDQFARIKAIDSATAKVKHDHPEFFREDEDYPPSDTSAVKETTVSGNGSYWRMKT